MSYSSSSSSCSSSAYETVTFTKEDIDLFRERLIRLMDERELPDLSELDYYKVYALEESWLGFRHWSIVLAKDRIYFTLELTVSKTGGKQENHMRSVILDDSKIEKLIYKGEVLDTGMDLINKAIKVFETFGKYLIVSNNCQKYCNLVLSEFGLGDKADWTDTQKGLVGAAVMTGAALCRIA